MKKIISILMILILLCGCGASEEVQQKEETENQPDEWGITFSVSDVTATGATVIFTQTGGNPTGELTTGSYYRIEKDGKELPYVTEGNIGWTSEAYMIPPEGSYKTTISWEWLYGELEPGTYRIYKGVSDWRAPGDSDGKEYSAEFVIE
ncbi:MAG: hypothetical protein IJ945_06300 [Oscillospiraceae bacterium]|nr:hypothetical protein [Oscillospiraceae bacterium]